MKSLLLVGIDVAFIFLSLLVSQGFAQESDRLAASLGLTRQNGALPPWEKPSKAAVEDLSRQVKSSLEGIMLVGHPDHGYGTAWVISRRQRLLATNAHVADIMHHAGTMMAIRNGSAEVYQVDKVWYHPGVLRKKSGSFSVRSQDPNDGDVDGFSPDVAVLRLAAGPEIPVELPLASEADVKDVFAQPVAMLGFPGYDTAAWPQLGQKAEATFHQGVVSRLTDFNLNVDVKDEERQMIQHTMASWGGFSGSPLFLPSGRVIGLHNLSRQVARGQETRSIPHGVRVDCLWELIAFHNLDDVFPLPIDKSTLDVARYTRPRPQDQQFDEAVMLASQAEIAIAKKDYTKAIELCEQAMGLAPGYPEAHYCRGMAYSWYAMDNFYTLTKNQRNEYCDWAIADIKKALQLEPTRRTFALDYSSMVANRRISESGHRDRANLSDLREIVNRLLGLEGLTDKEKAEIYSARAGTQGDKGMLEDLNTAIALDPWTATHYDNLYRALMNYDSSKAQQAKAKYEALNEMEVASLEAWDLVTASDPDKRNGERAFELVSKAYGLCDGKCGNVLKTLAAVYAELGDFEQALDNIQKAINLETDPKSLDFYRRMQRTFVASRPFRQ